MGLNILKSARDGSENTSSIIVVVLGGLTYQEITEIASFERDQLSNENWFKERIILGSVPFQNEECVLTAPSFIKLVAKTKIDKSDEIICSPRS